MKKIVLVLVSFWVSSANAQNNLARKPRELGLNVGYSTYLGDLQPKNYTHSQPGIASGINFRQYFTDRISAKIFVNFARLKASDEKSGDASLYHTRNLSFRSDIKELGIQGEVSLFRFSKKNSTTDSKKTYQNLTPYLFGGFNIFYFSPKAYYKGQWVALQPLSTEGVSYSKVSMALPFGLGVKYQITSKWMLGIELGSRKTFTDYIDDVSTSYPDKNTLQASKGNTAVDLSWRAGELASNSNLVFPAKGEKRGDPSNKDWYLLTQLTISYKLGK